MIAAFNFPERVCLMESGEKVPIAFFLGQDQVESFEECDSVLAGPYHEWTGKRYESKYVKIEKSAINLLEDGAAH